MKRVIILLLLSFFTVAAVRAENFGEWSRPVNLGKPINSSADDLSAVLTADGLTLYFTSNRAGSEGEDIWVAKRRHQNAVWEEPENLGATVNSPAMDRLRSISPDGRVLLFQSNRPGSFGGNDIWASFRRRTDNDFGWGTPVNLGAVINTPNNEIAANYLFGQAGQNHQFFFSSVRRGGLGDADIYTSEIFANGSFGHPVNLFELNSPFTEACFWVREDGLEIIFSSTRDGLNNDLDSFDLWTARRRSVFESWSPPVNLGRGINTERRDVNPSVSADWQTMYFTSNRNGGLGGNDIYLTTRRGLPKN